MVAKSKSTALISASDVSLADYEGLLGTTTLQPLAGDRLGEEMIPADKLKRAGTSDMASSKKPKKKTATALMQFMQKMA